MERENFITGLTENKPELVLQAAKSDLHNHAALGSRLDALEKWAGKRIPAAPEVMKDIGAMDHYIRENLIAYILGPGGFEYAMEAAFRQAHHDGIRVLQMSFDLRFFMSGDKNIETATAFLSRCQAQFAPNILFLPQLGIDRALSLSEISKPAEACIDSGFFRSVDLYGEELARDPAYFKPLFEIARKVGMKLTAHAGEFGDAALVRHTAEVLGLYEIQHGIAIASSVEMLRWARNNNIQLNICPTSNVRLSRVESLAKHPIRVLFDQGIKVTVNTDDLMIFGQSVSDEFFNLYKAGVFTAEELDVIRMYGLRYNQE